MTDPRGRDLSREALLRRLIDLADEHGTAALFYVDAEAQLIADILSVLGSPNVEGRAQWLATTAESARMLVGRTSRAKARKAQVETLVRMLTSCDPTKRAATLVQQVIYGTWTGELRAIAPKCPTAAEAHADPDVMADAVRRVQLALDRSADDAEAHVRAGMRALGCSSSVARNLFSAADHAATRKTR